MLYILQNKIIIGLFGNHLNKRFIHFPNLFIQSFTLGYNLILLYLSLFGLFQFWPFGTLNWLMCPFDLIVDLRGALFLPFDISRCFRLIFSATEPSQFSKVATNVSLYPAILLYLGIYYSRKGDLDCVCLDELAFYPATSFLCCLQENSLIFQFA